MGSSESFPANNDGSITIDKSVVEGHLKKFADLEKRLKDEIKLNDELRSQKLLCQSSLSEERLSNSALQTKVAIQKNQIGSLQTELAALRLKATSDKADQNDLRNQILDSTKTVEENQTEGLHKAVNDPRTVTSQRDYYHRMLLNERSKNSEYKTALESSQHTNRNIISENAQLSDINSTLRNKDRKNLETIDELTRKIKEIEERLPKESKKILTNEQYQSKYAEEALKNQVALKIQNEQLVVELTRMKKTKLLAVQTALDDLSKRAELISNQIIRNVKSHNRKNYSKKFQILKDANDRVVNSLTGIAFTKRFYQDNHDDLLKLQEDTDKMCTNALKSIHEITENCKKLANDYNSTIPGNFLKAIDAHTNDLDELEKINFKVEFAKEVSMQAEILKGLAKERDMLEGICKAEKRDQDISNEKPNNNLSKVRVYDMVVYNMAEANNDYDDIVAFETFMKQVTGRRINCLGVERFGVLRKTPRPAKVTLKSFRDFKDVLNSNPSVNFQQYGHVRVDKFYPNRTKGNVDQVI